MRIRSLTILATSTLAALLGCPLDSLQGTAEPAAAGDTNAGGSGLIADNTARHDDRVDAADDVSWVQRDPLPPGRSALRVLMTDAPVDAESVFVTFCGVQVHAAGAATAGGARDATDAAQTPDARGERPEGGAGGAAGAGGAPGAGGASSDSRSDGPADPGAAGRANAAPPGAADRPSDADPTDPASAGGRAGDDDGSEPAEGTERDDAARTEAERAQAEAERAEAERAEAERARAEAERAEGASAGGRGSDDGARPEDIAMGDGDAAGSWLTIAEGCQTLDLLTLRDGVTEALGATTLPPGRYGQIRLMLVDATIVQGGVEQALTLPSGTESGLKIVGGFTLRDGVATTITLDFDAGRSIHYAPGTGFMMTPVIDVVDVTVHGDAGNDVSEGDSAKPRDDGRGGAPGAGGAGGAGAGGRGGAGAAPSDSPPRAEPTPRPEATPPADKDPRADVPPPPDAPQAEDEPPADEATPDGDAEK